MLIQKKIYKSTNNFFYKANKLTLLLKKINEKIIKLDLLLKKINEKKNTSINTLDQSICFDQRSLKILHFGFLIELPALKSFQI